MNPFCSRSVSSLVPHSDSRLSNMAVSPLHPLLPVQRLSSALVHDAVAVHTVADHTVVLADHTVVAPGHTVVPAVLAVLVLVLAVLVLALAVALAHCPEVVLPD